MSLPVDVATIISYGKICSYLAANDFSRKKMFTGGYYNTDLPNRLDVATDLVEWAYNRNNNDPTLVSTANYLYQLCGKYIGQAKLIIGAGGSGTIINPATGVVSTIVASTITFRIGDVGALMNAGDTSLVLAFTSILNGSVTATVDSIPLPPSMETDRDYYLPTYTTPSVTLNFSFGARTGQVYVITYFQYQAV